MMDPARMKLGRWIDAPALRELLTNYGRLAFARPSAADVRGLLDLPAAERLAGLPRSDVMLAASGKLREGPGPRSAEAARAAFREGWTLVIRQADRRHGSLDSLARAAEDDLGGRCSAQVYSTPGGKRGFGWHYDAEQVVILQIAGRKEYYFRPNTVNPKPSIGAMPRDMRFELETSPVYACELAAGDLLHLPSGWWHRAEAREDALSISLGLLL